MKTSYAVCKSCGSLNKLNLDQPEGKAPLCGKCKQALPVAGAVVEITDQGFSKLLKNSDLPIILDLWAPWCGPCRSFAPSFAKVAESLAGKIVFAKINTDQNPATPQSLGIRGIPTLILFRNGQEINRVSGSLPQDEFQKWLLSSLQ